MRVAIVVPAESGTKPLWHHPRFLRPELLLAEGFAELGHEATIICHAPDTFPADIPALAVARETLGDVNFWCTGGYDMVIVWTWLHSYGDVVDSASSAGSFVVSRGDTHGLVGVRAHPRETLLHAYHSTPWLLPRLRSIWWWVKRFAYLHERGDAPILENLERADATVVETDVAREELIEFLRACGAEHLASKVHVVPFTALDLAFRARRAATAEKERCIYAVGRWDDPAKNTPLLISTLRRYLAVDIRARVVIAGPGGEGIRGSVGSPRCDYVGQVDHATLVELMAKARVCLVTSRWEGFHAGAHEAAANGVTIVGTPIPAMRSLVAGGRFGTLARSHRTRDLVRALASEMERWDRGDRDAGEIATYWRERLSPRALADAFARLTQRADAG